MGRAFVYVQVDVETAAERLRRRRGSSSRFARLSLAEMRVWLGTYERALTSVFEYAGHITNAPCLRLDGSLPIDEAARNVARFLDDLLPVTAETLSPAAIASGDRS
jgi:thymidylate kinase